MKHDPEKAGYIDIKKFKAILLSNKINLEEIEARRLVKYSSISEENQSINYKHFIDELYKVKVNVENYFDELVQISESLISYMNLHNISEQ